MQYIRYNCNACFRINSLGTHDNNIASLEALEQLVESNYVIRLEYDIDCKKCSKNICQFCADCSLDAECYGKSKKVKKYPEYQVFYYNSSTVSIVNNTYLQQYGKFTLSNTSYFDETKKNGQSKENLLTEEEFINSVKSGSILVARSGCLLLSKLEEKFGCRIKLQKQNVCFNGLHRYYLVSLPIITKAAVKDS
jgi:hypothetical protein